MALIDIAPVPGVLHTGTVYQAKGRWWDANLMRPREGELRPIKGWQLRSGAAAMVGLARAMFVNKDNSNNRWIVIGTNSRLYAEDEAGALYNITPAGFTAGRADATQNLGYGGGTYGSGFYGVPGSGTSSYLPATVWDLDGWGEDIVGCSDFDGKIYRWQRVTGTPAAVVTNAPTGCVGLVVTEDGFLFALQASGDRRRIAWCDQQNLTVWAASSTNQAGDYDLPTPGTIMAGKAVPGGALILTDVDAWLAQYINTPLIYSFQRVGSGCGPISRGAVTTRDSLAAWMGRGGFWFFNGQSVQPLDCEVRGAVLDNMNANQISKVVAVHLPDQGEVWWFYASAASNENDSYVAWCYRESQRLGRNVWMLGKLARTCGTPAGVFANPLMASPAGLLYEHETGLNYDGVQPFIETGVIELGKGDTLMEIQRVVPDATADGDVQATIYGRNWPNGPEAVLATVTLTSPTDLLVQAREVRVRYTILTDSAVGSMRFDVIRGDPV